MPFINPPITVSALIYGPEGVLLQKRSEGAKSGQGKWELPGGFLDVGENLEACLIRELEEELEVEVRGKLEYFGSHLGEYPTDGRKLVAVYFRIAAHLLIYQQLQPKVEYNWFKTSPPSSEVFALCDWRALKDFERNWQCA